MRKIDEIKLDALSKIDEEIIDRNTQKRIDLINRYKKRKKKMMRIMLTSAACFVLIASIILGIIPTAMAGIPVYEGMSVSDTAPKISPDGEEALNAGLTGDKSVVVKPMSKTVFVDDDDDDDDGDDDDRHHHGSTTGSRLEYNSAEDAYYAEPNQDIYITVHINNPSKYEILSFTLNGVKYSSYMFEDGSDLENLVLKCNVGDQIGVHEYTIDEIKYVKGEKIKNVIMQGDRTIKVMVRPSDLVVTDGLESVINFDLIKQHYGVEKFDTLAIYENGTLIKDLNAGAEPIGKLPFDKSYMLVGKYTQNGNIKTFECPFSSPKTSNGLLVVDGKVAGIGSCTDSTLYINLPVADNAFNGLNTQIKRVYFGEGATSIGNCAFSGCSLLEEVMLSSTLIEIGNSAFAECNSLQSIYLPNSLKKMGSGAIFGEKLNAIHISSLESYLDITYVNCSNPLMSAKNLYLNGELVTDLVIPDTIKSLKEGALAYCTSLKSVTFPQGFEKIGEYAFQYCSSLKSVSLQQGIEEISPYAFLNCTALEEINLPDSLTKLGHWAFCGCTSLKSIKIPQNVKEITVHTFMGCESLQSVEFTKGLESIGMVAFRGCTSLESIVLPEGLKTIDKWAFVGCTSLKSVVVPEGVERLEEVFTNCTALQEVTIPSSVKAIDRFAFEGCTSLNAIHISSLEGWLNISFGSQNADEYGGETTTPQYYAKNLYLNGELVTEIVIPNSITKINRYAFSGCKSIERIVLHDSVTEIGNYAFCGTGITDIIIPSSVHTVGIGVFDGCDALKLIQCEATAAEGEKWGVAWRGNTGAVVVWGGQIPTYNILYNLNGGRNGANPSTYSIDKELILEDATREGYTFDGWYDTIFGKVTSIPKGSTGNKTLHARWTPIVYTITYELDGGSNVTNPSTYTIESTEVLNAPTKENYEFLGWYNGDELVTTLEGHYGNLTLTAKYKPIPVTN